MLETVRGLLQHRSFTMSNPNRIRSLIGAFAGSNPAAFHAEDGSGYQFLVEMLTDLNSRNPQVASRLIEPLIRLKRYDAKRQEKMRAALEQLKGLGKSLWRSVREDHQSTGLKNNRMAAIAPPFGNLPLFSQASFRFTTLHHPLQHFRFQLR
ncbi:aminopeptidase N [Escherichia coli]|uniref:Aminopeptidase N n=1 Tax=Escherichia coli TaxID=562 RepID=A0A485JIX8_ECOLX|nr:aminopeptidase N [Escherichia coli]